MAVVGEKPMAIDRNHRNVHDLMPTIGEGRSTFPLFRLEHQYGENCLHLADSGWRKGLEVCPLQNNHPDPSPQPQRINSAVEIGNANRVVWWRDRMAQISRVDG
jgi:hypothetical protein